MTGTIPTWTLIFVFGPVALTLLTAVIFGVVCIYHAVRRQFKTKLKLNKG